MTEQFAMNNSRYQFYGQIGRGGIGEVYRCLDTFFRRDIALKMLRKDTLGPDFIRYFSYRYAQDLPVLSQLSNPNIIRLIELTQINNSPAWTMEFLPGNSFQQFCGQQIPFNQAAGMLIPVADALAYAHQFGIVHGNLKPSNILLNANQAPVLTDFCLMQYLSENGHGYGAIEANVGIGSPDYLAPEQARGLKTDPRTDVYSLGIIFYELVTGRKPFSAIAPMDIMAKQVNEPLPSPRYFVQNISPAAEQAMYQATAKQSASRISSMGEFALILRSLAADASAGAYYPPASYYENGFEDEEEESKSIKERLQDVVNFFKASRKRMIIAGCAAAIVILLIIGGIISGHNRNIANLNATNTQIALDIVETQDAVRKMVEEQAQQTAAAEEQIKIDATNAAMQATNAAAVVPTAAVATLDPAGVPTIDVNAAAAPTAAVSSSGRFQSQDPADGVDIVLGATFNLVWTVENTGGSNWTTDYKATFNSGSNFATGGVTSVNIPVEVWPGGATGITIPCTAPTTLGTYTMEWFLADASGNSFFSPLTLTIDVVDGELTATPAPTAADTATPTTWVDPEL